MRRRVPPNHGVNSDAQTAALRSPFVRRLRRGRWASRRIWSRSSNARIFTGPNRLLNASAESVCVTSPPALISSLYWCA